MSDNPTKREAGKCGERLEDDAKVYGVCQKPAGHKDCHQDLAASWANTPQVPLSPATGATARPWKAWSEEVNRMTQWHIASGNSPVAKLSRLSNGVAEANAALIVEAVNAYEGLKGDNAHLRESVDHWTKLHDALKAERDALKANVKTAFDLECESQRTIATLRAETATLGNTLQAASDRVEGLKAENERLKAESDKAFEDGLDEAAKYIERIGFYGSDSAAYEIRQLQRGTK